MTTSLTAIILAGGSSSRMGRDKALLVYRGVPLLGKISTLAGEFTDTVYVVTPRPELYKSIVPTHCRIIRESLPTNGPLLAFASVLPLVTTDWVLLLPCDLPFLTGDFIAGGRDVLSTLPPDIIALVPRREGLWEPLCAFYRSSCLAGLNKYLEKGGKSFQGWLNSSPVRELSINNPDVLFNCNTPDDWNLTLKPEEIN